MVRRGCSKLSLFLVIIFALTVLSQYPRCQDDQRVFFSEEPTDVTARCEPGHAAVFHCKYNGTLERPQWIINSQRYSTLELPQDHFYRNYTLIVENIKPQQNNTRYHCEVVFSNQGSPCAFKSSVARLIVECKAFDVQYTSHYNFKREKPERLTGISTVVKTNTRFSGFDILYNIKYSDPVSGVDCKSIKIPASSCWQGICRNDFIVSSSLCSNANDVDVTVGVTSIDPDLPDFSYTSDPIKIDVVNNFIDVSFERESSKISLNFINQPKEGDKQYSIRYGPLTPGCRDLPSQTDGRLSNLNSLSLELNFPENTSICFNLSVNNGTKFVTVEGTYESDNSEVKAHSLNISITVVSIIFTIIGILCVLISIVTVVVCKQYFSKKTIHDKKEEETDGYQLKEYATSDDKKSVIKLDKSTTFFKLHEVTNDCLMYKFAMLHYPSYQPEDGYGYFKTTVDKLEETSRHKKLILMAEDIPRYVTFRSDIEEFTSTQAENCSDVYEQNRSFTMQLSSGDSFLYCARSKDITATAFWETYDVTENCKQPEFAAKSIPRYISEWFRYCYFEFTKSEYIKPHQRVIVLKKDGTLFTGPGIRHIVGATGDGSKMTHVPKFPEDWKHVFIQSREVDRDLTKCTKYLFCAMMDRVRAHHSIYAIKKKCNMAVFASRHIPGFKPELGYGYYEFKEDEFFKPHKKVILVAEDNKLYTGGGAQFVCAGGQYTMDAILRKTKISPPDLNSKKWKHIFIQSQSERRELLPGQKFLYCEYKTYK